MTINRILLAVDESSASSKAANYVGDLVRSSDAHFIHLCHVLPPPLPFDPLDPSGDDERPEQDSARATEPLLPRELREHAEVLDQARKILLRAGVDRSLIDTELRSLEPMQTVAQALLGEAEEKDCDTIVVGRTELPWYRRVVRRHIGDELVTKASGRSVWIVE